MKKIIVATVMVALATALPKLAKAQAPDTNTIEKLQRYIAGPIDKTQIPTGFLEDYGVAFAVAGVFHRQHFKLRVDVRLRVKRIKNPILFVIQHALRNMSNSLLEPSSRPSCNEGEICLKVGQLFCFCSVYSLFF
ncbi:MAG: hypothetical protein EAY72_00340 [Bacteroidetes bacterium]|nr:MAG: hypothetical protein EAY72_00340 [Bacteroidota bacterium]